MTTILKCFEDLLMQLRAEADIASATALRYDSDGAQRIYSSHPEAFAQTGFKQYHEAPMIAQVRCAQAPILTDGIEALKQGFADWQTILAQGCDAIVNIPVRDPSGTTLGQLNLMGRSGAFEPENLARLQRIADRAAACFSDAPQQEASL